MNDEQREAEERLKLQNQMLEIENMAKQYLTSEALSRFGNLKSAHPQKAFHAAALIAQLVQQNQIKSLITDEQFKDLLIRLDNVEGKKEFRITRI